MDQELAALTSTVATTVVQLLTTAAWGQAKTAVGRLWQRVRPDLAETVQAELAETRTEALAARQTGDGQLEQALIGEWHSRLRRLVAADPEIVDDLRRIVAELGPLVADAPPQPTTIAMQATTFGHSQVNQAGRDLHVTER